MKNGKDTSIDIIPNSGLERKKYHFIYTSQRYREGKGNFGAACGINTRATDNMVLDKFDALLEVKTISDQKNKACKKYLGKNFMQQRFVPALFKGNPAKTYCSEEVFDHIREQEI